MVRDGRMMSLAVPNLSSNSTLPAELISPKTAADIQAAERVWVACSGGLDSVVLLDVVAATLPAERLAVVHINHQLSPHADHWQALVAQRAEQLGCHFEAHAVDCATQGVGLEAAARQARYAVFEALLGADELLLLGHHADDQLETLLYRLLRGAGLRGLAAIPQQRSIGSGKLLRPLLQVPRQRLEQYANQHQLQWVEDESNDRELYDRNYLRRQVTPALRKRWQQWHQPLARTTEYLREGDQLLAELAQMDLQACAERSEQGGRSLSIELLQSLAPRRQRNLLRYWPEIALQGSLVSAKELQQLEATVLTAREDAQPQLCGDGYHWRRFAGRLYLLLESLEHQKPAAYSLQWSLHNLPASLSLPDGSSLVATVAEYTAGGEPLLRTDLNSLSVRLREPGVRSRPVGRQSSAPLKNIFQEQGIPPWSRAETPLLWAGDKLAAVGGLWVEADCAAPAGQAGVKIVHIGASRPLSE